MAAHRGDDDSDDSDDNDGDDVRSLLASATSELLTSYSELNAHRVEQLDRPPTPLEFMRFVAKNLPFIVRQGIAEWPAARKWNADYLVERMGGRLINVAMTPYGNADSVVTTKDQEELFVKPFQAEEPFHEFFEQVRRQEHVGQQEGELVKYAQTQNDNLRQEYLALFSDVDREISWASSALEKEPDAINMWIGNSHSTSALHRDNYENIFCQVVGSKQFVLLPPIDAACIRERMLPSATYCPDPEKPGRLRIQKDEPEQRIPFPTWDPDHPGDHATPVSNLSNPVRCILSPGDVLYLPALWFHKVSQTCSSEGFCCAVNYWYDMEFGGSFFPMATFVRNLAECGDSS